MSINKSFFKVSEKLINVHFLCYLFGIVKFFYWVSGINNINSKNVWEFINCLKTAIK